MNLRRPSRPEIDLFLLSALALYAEVVLIRWMGAEIRMFAYLKNFTLFAAFVGLGLGMLRRRGGRLPMLLSWLLSLLAVVLSFSSQLRLTRLFFPDPSIHQWGGNLRSPELVPAARALPGFGLLFQRLPDAAVRWVLGAMALAVGLALFACVVGIFYLLGGKVGRLLALVNPPLSAYTVNLVGSLFGTVLYAGLVFLGVPPWVWLLPLFACLVYFSDRRVLAGGVLGVALAVALVAETSSHVLWSPYYRISYVPTHGDSYTMTVDHDFHQDMLDLRPQSVQRHPALKEPLKYYSFPYAIAPKCGRVLVVGAGTGNDVAAALRAGCASIDAVEIDPVILELGSVLHPEHPYDSTRVTQIANDGRAFFHQARVAGKSYDLIVFGLVDSQTALSVVSSLRLEFLLYSVESFREALSLLNRKDGLLVVGFSVGWKDWIAQRLYQTLAAASGQEPLALKTSNYVGVLTLLAGPGLPQARQALASFSGVKDLTPTLSRVHIKLVRDDWPFLYYNPETFPFVYLSCLILVMLCGWFLVSGAIRNGHSSSWGAIDWPMFFMGSAFLLVETKNISQLAILFGSTWITNLVVFASVFVMAILANLLIERRPVASLPTLYGLLGAALLLSYVTPFSDLTQFSPMSRAAVGGLITALPVLFSSLIFAKMFKETALADAGLGSNILGGLFGGAVEALSIFTGIRVMVLLAIGIYAASWVAYSLQHRERLSESPVEVVGQMRNP